MIAPQRLEFQNFLSFQTFQTFNFETEGIHYIYGINHDADIDRNEFTAESYNTGVGKSSLALALQYVFYGDIQRRINKDQIINKTTGKNMYVGLEFLLTSTNEKYMIKRYRRHDDYKNRLFLLKWNGKKWNDISGVDLTQTQEFIDKIIILDIRTFEKTSLLTREDKMQFLELPILNRGMIFENISQINKLKEYWIKAKGRLRNFEDALVEINNNLLTESTIIKRDKKYIEEIKENDEYRKKELQQTILNFESELEELLSSNLSIDLILQNIIIYKNLVSTINDLKLQINNQQKIQKIREQELLSIQKDVDDLIVDIQKAKQRVDSFKPKTCHNCGAVQDPQQYKKEHDDLILHYETLNNKLELKTDVLITLKEQLKEANEKYDEIYLEQQQNLKTMSEILLPDFIKQAIVRDDMEVVNNIKGLQANILSTQSILNSIDNTEAITKIETEIKDHLRLLKDWNEKKKDNLKQQEIYQFWLNVLDFKNENSLKQFIISKIIPLFNNFVQQMIDVVYKGNLIITFDTFFNETILYQGSEWKYDELSTGEKMKLNFCINLAIFDLTRINMDSCGVIFLDEIFTNIDGPTIIEFLDIIKERYAIKNGVYIISHEQKVRDNLKPDSTILIEKRNMASEITKIEREE